MPVVTARFRPHPKGFGFATPVGADRVTPTAALVHDGTSSATVDSVFVPPPVASGLLADDLVSVEVELDDRGATASAVTLVQRPTVMLVGTVVQGPGRLVVEPDRAVGGGWIDLEPSLAAQLVTAVGRLVIVMLGQADDGTPVARLLVAGPFVVGSPAAVRAAAVVVAFNRAAPGLIPGGAAAAGLDETEAVGTATRIIGLLASGRRGGAAGLDATGEVPGRELLATDHTAEVVVTIDSETTRDLDDAVGAAWDGTPDGNVTLAVHIADAAGVVGLGSPADRYARVMGATAYLSVGENAPMLDPALSEDALSLLPGQERGVLSLWCVVTPGGDVLDVHVELAVVRSDAKLTYAAVERWLDGDDTAVRSQVSTPDVADDVVETLVALREAADRLGVERDDRDTIEDLFTQAEVEPAIIDGKIRTRDAEPHVAAYRLIERLMVATNESVAGWLVHHEVPALYRAHAGLDRGALPRIRAAVELVTVDVPALAAPDPDVDLDACLTQLVTAIDAVGEGASAELLATVVANSMARASYEPDPTAHRGLASAAYVHFTSPIRRYADLVVHRQVRAALAGAVPLHEADELGPLGRWLDARAGAASYAGRRERDELWTIILDRGFVRGTEPAVVTGITPNGLRLRLPRLGVTGFLQAEKALRAPRGARESLEVDQHGLASTSGPSFLVGSTIDVEVRGRDGSGRLDLRMPPP